MRSILLLTWLLAGLLPPPAEAEKRRPTAEEAVRAMISAINARDWDSFRHWVAEDVVRESGATPDFPVENRTDLEAFLKQDLAAFPDAEHEIRELFAGKDHVTVLATYRGTQRGPIGLLPATDRAIELPYLALYRVREGRITSIREEWDNVHVLTQLGFLPPLSEYTPAPRVMEASCGQCQFGMAGSGCTLAVRVNGESYYVTGTQIDDHGDAHAPDGFCETIRKAEVTGHVKGEEYHVTAFRLLPLDD